MPYVYSAAFDDGNHHTHTGYFPIFQKILVKLTVETINWIPAGEVYFNEVMQLAFEDYPDKEALGDAGVLEQHCLQNL